MYFNNNARSIQAYVEETSEKHAVSILSVTSSS